MAETGKGNGGKSVSKRVRLDKMRGREKSICVCDKGGRPHLSPEEMPFEYAIISCMTKICTYWRSLYCTNRVKQLKEEECWV